MDGMCAGLSREPHVVTCGAACGLELRNKLCGISAAPFPVFMTEVPIFIYRNSEDKIATKIVVIQRGIVQNSYK